MGPGRARARACRLLFFNPENRSTTIVKKNTGDTGATSEICGRAGGSRTSDTGDTPVSVSPAGKPEYEVKWDTLGRFSTGQVITGSAYGAVKEEYDVRMKDWDGAACPVAMGSFTSPGGNGIRSNDSSKRNGT